jgi:hypothetical protein
MLVWTPLSSLAPRSCEEGVPRYFFHLRDGSDVLLDPEGRSLDGPHDLNSLAVQEARSLISHEARDGRIHMGQRIEVEDAAGNLLCKVEFADAVLIVGGWR